MHPIHKHMSGRMSARKADERYDAKEAYNKNLSGKARLHYLENDIHDKGMSMKAPMDMKSPMDMGHMSAAKMKTPMEMGHSPAEMDHSPAELKSPYNMGHKSPADMKSPMEKGHESAKQEKKDLMKYNPIDDRAGSPAEANMKNLLGKRGRDLSQKAIDRKVKKGKGKVEYNVGGGFLGVGKGYDPDYKKGGSKNPGVYVSKKGKRHKIKK